MSADEAALERLIIDVPDFPEPGITFKDITPLLADPSARSTAVDALSAPFADAGVDAVFGIESRGFIFGVGVADALGCAFVPVRKPGKLPRSSVAAAYDLEYGSDALHVHTDAARTGANVLIVDDVLATGGSAGATVELCSVLGANVVGVSVLIELVDLRGAERLSVPVASVLRV